MTEEDEIDIEEAQQERAWHRRQQGRCLCPTWEGNCPVHDHDPEEEE